MEKDHILGEIRRTAAENGGKPLGRSRFFQQTGIKDSDWLGKLWPRWSAAGEGTAAGTFGAYGALVVAGEAVTLDISQFISDIVTSVFRPPPEAIDADGTTMQQPDINDIPGPQ